MRVDPNLLNIVMFLCQEREEVSGTTRKVPTATAFLVRIEGPGRNPLIWKYLVTARHNIELAADPIYVRCNLWSGGVDHFETLKEEWIGSDDSDVSCWPFWTPEEPQRNVHHASIPLNQLVGRDLTYSGPPLSAASAPSPIVLGDALAFVGLFSKHPGSSKNVPIVRFGDISAMPGEPIRLKVGDQENLCSIDVVGYLAECRSWGGHSGSPVLWTATVRGRVIEAPGVKQAEQRILLNGLLGLVSGHFDIEQEASVTGDVLGQIETAINSGIALITPASAITELLTRDDLVERRRSEI